jgi:hypothetical protein
MPKIFFTKQGADEICPDLVYFIHKEKILNIESKTIEEQITHLEEVLAPIFIALTNYNSQIFFKKDMQHSCRYMVNLMQFVISSPEGIISDKCERALIHSIVETELNTIYQDNPNYLTKKQWQAAINKYLPPEVNQICVEYVVGFFKQEKKASPALVIPALKLTGPK